MCAFALVLVCVGVCVGLGQGLGGIFYDDLNDRDADEILKLQRDLVMSVSARCAPSPHVRDPHLLLRCSPCARASSSSPRRCTAQCCVLSSASTHALALCRVGC